MVWHQPQKPVGWAWAVAGVLVACAGCATRAGVPQPEPVLDAYAEALAAGDADAIYDLLSEDSRKELSRAELKRILATQSKELKEHAKELQSPDREITTRAQVRYADGEIVTLDLDDGEFHVTAADALPAAATSPEQALGQLRRVLARRSYPGLLRVLTPRTRSSMEGEVSSLVDGLNAPEALDIEVVGDTATVTLPGGHKIELRREDGVWLVDNFR